MDPENVANVIAGAALLLSMGVWVRSEVSQRKSAAKAKAADEAAARAVEAAERSAKAAEASLELEGRSAAALEKMADQWGEYMSREEKRDQRQWSARPSPGFPSGYESRDAAGEPWAGPPPPVVPSVPVVHWTVDKVKGRRHRLTNLGRATALGVELRAENAVRFDGPEVRDVAIGEAVEFLIIGSLHSGTPELVVTWRNEPDGDSKEWRRPVP